MSGVRVEWLKARARSLRWHEELVLLPEEVRRTIRSHLFKAQWWEDRVATRADIDPALQEGLAAYAARQAGIRWGLARQVNSEWQKVRPAALSALEGGPACLLQAVSAVVGTGETNEVPATAAATTDDDDSDDELLSDDEGVQELDESEAVIAYMELDVVL